MMCFFVFNTASKVFAGDLEYYNELNQKFDQINPMTEIAK